MFMSSGASLISMFSPLLGTITQRPITPQCVPGELSNLVAKVDVPSKVRPLSGKDGSVFVAKYSVSNKEETTVHRHECNPLQWVPRE